LDNYESTKSEVFIVHPKLHICHSENNERLSLITQTGCYSVQLEHMELTVTCLICEPASANRSWQCLWSYLSLHPAGCTTKKLPGTDLYHRVRQFT